MELRKIAFKKPMKLLTLLLTSMLIATVSAATYYSLTMEPQVTVSTPVVKFASAPDEPSGSNVKDAWCSLTAKSYPNATLTYEKAVYINNTDSGNAHSIKLRHVSITPANGTSDVGNWSYMRFIIYDENATVQASLNYTVSGTNWILEPSSGETSYYSMPASAVWWIRLVTRSPAAATPTKVCNINIAVDVQE